MSILYKSSKFNTYAYWVIYPVIICICLYCIFGIVSYGDFGLFSIIMILVFLFCLVAATECLLKLRCIEVTEDYILVKKINKLKVVKFKDVAYVYDLISFKGSYLVLWYRDTDTRKLEVVLVRPEMEKMFSNFMNRVEILPMTKFIREKAMRENPNYLLDGSRRWFLFSISPYF